MQVKKDITIYLKHHKKQRSVVIFFILVTLALISSYIVNIYLSFQVESKSLATAVKIDDVPFYPQPFIIDTNAPTYFNSYANVRYIFASVFGDIFKNCSIFASLDNSTWVNVPIAYNQSDLNTKKPANLGLVKLDTPSVTIYLKTLIPPQTVTVYYNITKDFIMENNFEGNISVVPVPSSLDIGKSIFSFFALFSVTFVVYNFFKSRNKETNYGRNEKNKIKSKYKVKRTL